MAERYDLDAIAADDALLDLLAAGGSAAFGALEAGERDPDVHLLADLRLAVEVEDELPIEHIDDAERFLARCAAVNPVTDPLARKIAARSLALGVAAVAALSVSGVAAAVTGDPLSPYEKLVEKVVQGIMPETTFPKEDLQGLPVSDKAKIVKVAKDYKEQRAAAIQAEQKAKDLQLPNDLPAEVTTDPKPPLARVEPPALQQDQPKADTAVPELQVSEKPTAEPTTEPTTEQTTQPTTDPTTQPTTEPTTQPTPEPTPEPTATETAPPTTQPTSDGNTGETGSEPGTVATTAPPTDTSQSETGGDQGSADGQAQAEPSTGQNSVEDTGGGTTDSGGVASDTTDQAKPADPGKGDEPADGLQPGGEFTPEVLNQILGVLNGVMVTS
jgi:hypothetical protein